MQDKPDIRIVLAAERFQEIVSVTVENDCNPVRWRAGMPISEKGEIYRRSFPEPMMQYERICNSCNKRYDRTKRLR